MFAVGEVNFEKLASLFLVGSAAFWCLLLAELVLLLVSTEFENGILATASLAAFLLALQFAGDANPLGLAARKWYYLIPAALAYVAMGVGFGVFMWRRLVNKRLERHDAMFADFLREKGLPPDTVDLPENLKVVWSERMERNKEDDGQTLSETPRVGKNKARIIRWMSLWVFCFVLFIAKDMVVELYSSVYNRIASFLQRIADDIYSRNGIRGNVIDLEAHRKKVWDQEQEARRKANEVARQAAS